MEDITFAALGLRNELLLAVDKMGFEEPSPIQSKTIPLVIDGKDLVGLSQTGSGKTAAFALPSLQKIDLSKLATQVIVLCPTRELAVQVSEEIFRLGCAMAGLTCTPIYGGASMERQIKSLRRGSHIVVGTPGRLMDHLRRGTLNTDSVHTTILDEADRMLDMGFRDDIETILADINSQSQKLFFSATMNKGVKRLIEHYGDKPETISIEHKTLTVSTTEQCYYEVRNRSKVEVLSRLLDTNKIRLGIIFCNTKRTVEECYESLAARGYSVDRLHGDITQQNRERVFKRFRDGGIELLVATDVAARGLDIDDIDMVFNYDLPQDCEDYVHRIGRTGRAGREGKAVSFVYGRDVYKLESISRYIRHSIRREKIPSLEEVQGKRANKMFEKLKDRIDEGQFHSDSPFIDRLLGQGYAATDISSALFTMLQETDGHEGKSISEDSEPDGTSSKPSNNRSRRRGNFHKQFGGGKPYPTTRNRRGRSGKPNSRKAK